MTDKEYILQQLSKLNDEQAYFAKLFMQAIRGKAPDTRDAGIAAAVLYRIKGMKVCRSQTSCGIILIFAIDDL